MAEQTNTSLKECHMCAELVSVRAKKCKHCGEYFDASLIKMANNKEHISTDERDIIDKLSEYHKVTMSALKGIYLNLLIVTILYTVMIHILSFTIIGLILLGPIIYGFTAYSLVLVREKRSNYNLFISCFADNKFIESWLVVGTIIITTVGYVLLIPGITLAAWWYFIIIIVADKDNYNYSDFLEIISKSRALIRFLGIWNIFIIASVTAIITKFMYIPVVGIIVIPLAPYLLIQQIVLYDKAMDQQRKNLFDQMNTQNTTR